MKKARIFSAISLMLLSICILGAGVYAANESDRYMGITGGVIQVAINVLGVSVDGYIGTDTTKNPDFSSTYTTPQEDKIWELTTKDGKPVLEFNAKLAETADDVDDITLTFVITNESEVSLEAYFYDMSDNSETKKENDYLGASKTEEDHVVGVTLGSGDLAAATYAENNSLTTAGECTITIVFNLNKLLDVGESFDFGYILQVQEKSA